MHGPIMKSGIDKSPLIKGPSVRHHADVFNVYKANVLTDGVCSKVYFDFRWRNKPCPWFKKEQRRGEGCNQKRATVTSTAWLAIRCPHSGRRYAW